MKIEAQIKLRNANMRQRRLALGLTQKQLAERCGLSTVMIYHVENLKRQGRPKTLKKIATVLGCDVDDISIKWPKEVPTSDTITQDIPPHALEAYTVIARQRALEMANPPDKIDHEEMLEIMRKQIKNLSFRKREILSMRYGLKDGVIYTYQEIGRKFKITFQRVMQIEAKALRELQHPARSNTLVDYI